MWIILLVILELILCFISFLGNKRDIVSPPVLLCLFSFGSHFLALLNYNIWGLDIHSNTFVITLIAMVTVVFASFVAKLIRKINFVSFRIAGHNNYVDGKPITYSKKIFWLIVLIQLISIVWQVLWVLSIVGHGGSWSTIMYLFRSSNSTYTIDAVIKPRLLSMLQAAAQVISLIYGYIFSYNYAKNRKIDIKLYLPTVLYVIVVLLGAGRGSAVCIIIELIVLHYIMIQKEKNWSIRYSNKFIFRLLVFIIVMLVVFSLSRTLVGRMDQESTFAYISKYVGSEIKNFDMYLQNPPSKSKIWGKETFSTIHNQLWDNLNIPEWKYIKHLEFRNYNGIDMGNVYGAIRCFYADFGLTGVVVLTFIMSFIMTFIYYRIRRPRTYAYSKFDYRIILFVYLSYSLFVFPIFDDFYTKVVNTGNIELFLYFIIFKKLIIDSRAYRIVNRQELLQG